MFAGILSNGLVLAALIRPIPQPRKSMERNKYNDTEDVIISKSSGFEIRRSPHLNGHVKNGHVESPNHYNDGPLLGFKSKSNMCISNKHESSVPNIVSVSHTELIDQKEQGYLFNRQGSAHLRSRSRISQSGYLHSTTSIHNLSMSYLGSVHSIANPCVMQTDGGNNIEEMTMEDNASLCEKLLTTLKNMFNIKLYANVYVILFSFCAILMSSAHCFLYTFTPRRAESEGLTPYEVSLTLSLVGFGDIVGRILGGILGFKLDNTLLYFLATIWAGCFFIISSFARSFISLATLMFMSAVGIGKSMNNVEINQAVQMLTE